ncbi:MAG: phosphomannomutase/phosphoglucomutase [Bdellovibrionota bacterium]|nr:MAG: phosphomannomutase/phosphoglucomutase [Bdellovibrionota bacterium]
MTIPSHVFREYDIRGLVGEELTNDFAMLLGRAYGELAKESNRRTIAVGWDCRPSSESFAHALAEGISSEGLDVTLTGMGPTPQLYFSIFQRSLDGGIQVTGSHNPSNMNGFKMCLGTITLSAEQIRDLGNRMKRLSELLPAKGPKGHVAMHDIRQEYIDYLIANSRGHMSGRPLRVVVDAGNGVGGLVGPKVLKALGCQVDELFCEPDGRFPNHHPDPSVPSNLKTLIDRVRSTKADAGIAWDGDADRIGVVDEKGSIIYGDMLLLIYARALLKEQPGATVIADVKCSSRLFDDIKKHGGNPIMWKTGHSLIKGKLRESNGALAGEMSGHIFFKHRFFGFDDALYATCRFVEILSASSQPCSQLLGDLAPSYSTPELRVDCPEHLKFKIAEGAQTLFPEFQVSTIDGVRIEFEKGWGLVRASNTQPVLVMRFEAESLELLESYQTLVSQRIEALRAKLAA